MSVSWVLLGASDRSLLAGPGRGAGPRRPPPFVRAPRAPSWDPVPRRRHPPQRPANRCSLTSETGNPVGIPCGNRGGTAQGQDGSASQSRRRPLARCLRCCAAASLMPSRSRTSPMVSRVVRRSTASADEITPARIASVRNASRPSAPGAIASSEMSVESGADSLDLLHLGGHDGGSDRPPGETPVS